MASITATIVVAPLVAFFRLNAVIVGEERALPFFSQVAALLPGLSGVYLRRSAYRRVLRRCGVDSYIGFGTLLCSTKTSIGEVVYIGPYCILGYVDCEDRVLIGSGVSVINGGRQHGFDRLDVPIRDQPGECPRITIGEGAWIGDRAIVMADVGKHCVVGAGAVVTKPVSDYAVVAGNPARVLRFRNQESPVESPCCSATLESDEKEL